MTYTTPKRWLLTVSALLAAAGCHPRAGRPETKQRELMHTSFEAVTGWFPEVPGSLTTEKAHTGKHAIRVDAQHEYSPSYRIALGELCSHRPRRFTVGAWVWVPSYKDDAIIVVAISNAGDPDHPIFRKNVYMTMSGPFEQWKYVSRDLDLPPDINSRSLLTIYLWKSSANNPVYLDDLQLTELW